MNSDSEDDAFVEIDADLFLDARLVADDLAGRNAADRHLALARPEVLDREAGDIAADILDVVALARWMSAWVWALIEKGTSWTRRGALGRGDDDLGAFVTAAEPAAG